MSVLIHVDLIQKSYSRNIKIILDDETIYFNFNKNTLYRDNGYKVKKIKYYTNNNLLLKKQTKIFLNKSIQNNYINQYANLISSLKLSKLLFALEKSNKEKKILNFKL